jgi:D-alanyl-D-alanine carboxypeptidase
VLATLLATQPATAALRPAALDRALGSARATVRAPAAAGAIVACGRVLWARADGVTDRHSRRKVTNTTPFVIASTTKTVTATMIMQQVQAGRLSPQTRLAQFYPSLPNARKITLRMLLSNRSGLREYSDLPRVSNIIDHQPRHRWNRNELLTGLGKPQFAPGTRFKYTNTNWVVLGGILEKATGIPIETYFQRMVARPAGMSASTWTRSPAILRVMARPYTEESDGSLTSAWVPGFGLPTNYWGPVFTDGGLVSTATDLARFGNALLGGRLTSGQTVAQMTNVGRDNYGLGIFAKRLDGLPWLGHNGAYGGYESENFTDPARHVTITVTANLEEAGDSEASVSERIWKAVVKAYDGQVGRAPTVCS